MNPNPSTTSYLLRHRSRQVCLLLGLLCGLGGCLSPSRMLRQSGETCKSLPAAQVTGWVERLEGTCAVLWRSESDVIVVRRSALPVRAREGDYIHHGRIDAARRQRLKQQIQRLLRQRPAAPRVLKLEHREQETRRKKRWHRLLQRCPGHHKRTPRPRRQRLLPRRRWKHRPWRHRWQRWTYRPRCRHKRWRRWSKTRKRQRWFRLNTLKK